MSNSEFQPPLYTPKRLSDASLSPKFPSRSSIKSLKVEIHIENEQTYYCPGQEIKGHVAIFQTDKKTIKDFFFNDVEISFQNRLDAKLLDKTSKFLFKQDNSPKIDLDTSYNKGFVFKKAVTYPFKFTIPKALLDNACPSNYDIHRILMPSFGSPSHCGLRFNSKDVNYDLDSDLLLDSYTTMLDKLSFKNFMNNYSINVKININLDSAAHPVSLFQRNKEIKIKNDQIFDDISKDYISMTSRSALHLSDYYNLFETNALNEINFNNSMDVFKPIDSLLENISKNMTILGRMTLKSPLPMLLNENTKETLPLDLTFIPCYKELIIPKITVSYELNQYLVQSSKCFKPMGFNPSILEGLLDSKTLRMDNDGNEIFVMKVQTIFQRIHQLSNEDWIPIYSEDQSYNNHFQIGLPPIVKNKFIQSTFHHCLMQNIYALKITVSYTFEKDDDTIEVPKQKDSGKSSNKWSSLFGKTGDEKKKKNPNFPTGKRDNLQENLILDETNYMNLYIPITLL